MEAMADLIISKTAYVVKAGAFSEERELSTSPAGVFTMIKEDSGADRPSLECDVTSWGE